MATPLFTRWFQSQIFSPSFRLHESSSAGDAAAPWQGPAASQKVLVDCIRLRKRLAFYAQFAGADAPPAKTDSHARPAPATLGEYARAADQLPPFRFGPSFLVQPVSPGGSALTRLDLPAGSAWIDFWTGAFYPGAQSLRTPSPIEIIPLFVRAGTIVPMPPAEIADAAAEPGLELRIYPGADASFLLRDPACPIAFAWNDRENLLRVTALHGEKSFRAPRRRLDVVVVRPGRGAGLATPSRPDAQVEFAGQELHLTLPPPPALPHAPQGFTAVIQDSKIVFSWKSSHVGALYRLKRAIGPGAYQDLASALSATRHVVPIGDCALPCEFVLTAMDAGGESPPSPALKLSPPAPLFDSRKVPARAPAPSPAPAPASIDAVGRETALPLSRLVAGARTVWAADSTVVDFPPAPPDRSPASPAAASSTPRHASRASARQLTAAK